jgi:hypothetical protein
MIKQIDGMFDVWGAQRRYMDFGESQGYADQSAIGKIREFRLSDKAPAWFRKRQHTAKGVQDFILRPTQFTESGHFGEGLVIAKALIGAPGELRTIGYVHYVIRVTIPDGMKVAKYKSEQVGISEAEYWRLIDRLHHYVLGRLPASEEGYLTVATEETKFRPIPDRVAETAPPKPELNLEALRRERLKVWR